MRFTGKLIEWNDDRGFGFVEPIGGGERAFCHISAFANLSRRPALGEIVTYERSKDERGRLRAIQVRRAELRPKQVTTERTLPTSTRTPVFTSILFLIAVAAVAIAGRIPWF